MAMEVKLHFFDGGLARGLAYFGIAFWLSKIFWPWLARGQIEAHIPATALKKAFHIGSAFLVVSAILSINNVTLSAFSLDFRDSQLMVEELKVLAHGLWPIISQTSFGRYWSLYTGTILITYFIVLFSAWHKLWLWPAIVILLASITMMGHASESGFLSFQFFLHALHLLAISFWLSGIMLLAYCRFIRKQGPQPESLKRFSKVAALLLAVIVMSGILRLAEYVSPWSAFLASPFGWMLIFKIFLLLTLLPVAASLRKISQNSSIKTDWSRFDQYFTLEYFLIILLILISSMLSQLPTPLSSNELG